MSNPIDVAHAFAAGTLPNDAYDLERTLAQLPSLSVEDRARLAAMLVRLEQHHAAELRARDEQLGLVLGAVQMGIWEGDRRTGSEIWSPQLERLFGLPLHSGPHSFEEFYRLVHPEDLPVIRASLARAEAEGAASVEDLFRVIRPDGALVWIASRTILHRDEQGHVIRMTGVNTDVTAHKQIEQALRQSNESLGLALAAAQMGIWDWDIIRDSYSWDAAQYAIFGVDPQAFAISLEGVWERTHPDDRARLQALVAHALATGEPYQADFRIVRPDGAVRWCIGGTSVTLDHHGRPVRMSGITYDITERKRVEEQLTTANHRFRLAEAAAGGFNYDWDLETGVVTRSESMARVLGYTPEELEPSWPAWAALIHPDDRWIESAEAAVAHVRGHPDEILSSEYRVCHREGHYVWVLERAITLRDEHGRVRRVIGQTVDITERKRFEAERERLYAQEQAARAQAEEASRLKDEFLATVSHELRTPLTAFLGYAHLLQSRRRDEAYVARTVDKMVQSAKAQAQLIEDLLDVSRIVSGKLRLELQPLDLRAVVQAAVDTVRPMAEARDLRLRVELPEARAMMRGDAGRLQQVVWNLLTNAAKFTPAGGSITVRLASDGHDALLSVRDTGQGIGAAFLPYVFDQFRQADSTSQRTHGGLGLGLTIVRRLVELHGGTVSAASEGEGKGATFTVHLPPPRSGNGALVLLGGADAAVRASYPPGLRGLRVLVVDDQPDILELLYEIIAPAGAEVRCCTGAREALDLLRTWRPDALVSDIAMPGEDGYWLIKQVRALAPEEGGAVPALALTAYVRLEDRLRVLAEGFQLYVPKPVEPDELLDMLSRLPQARALA